MSDKIIFYIGTLIIILIFIFFVYSVIKNDETIAEDRFNLNEHKIFIILSIILLIGAIIAWRILFLTIFYGSVSFKHNQNTIQIQKILNG